jgi:hypothetical protein
VRTEPERTCYLAADPAPSRPLHPALPSPVWIREASLNFSHKTEHSAKKERGSPAPPSRPSKVSVHSEMCTVLARKRQAPGPHPRVQPVTHTSQPSLDPVMSHFSLAPPRPVLVEVVTWHTAPGSVTHLCHRAWLTESCTSLAGLHPRASEDADSDSST